MPTSDDPLDVEAMRRCASGETEAFSEIVGRHQDSLLNFFRRLGASSDEAEDLAQETFLRLYRWRRKYRPTAMLRTFLFTLARHVRTDHLRRRMRRIRTTAADEAMEMAADPREHPDENETRLDVQAALEQISEKLRAVVVLNVYEGLPYKEIGAILGIPEGTVKSRMFLAMRELRRILEGETDGNDDDETR